MLDIFINAELLTNFVKKTVIYTGSRELRWHIGKSSHSGSEGPELTPQKRLYKIIELEMLRDS